MCPLIYLKRKQTRALTLVVMCWAPGAPLRPFTLAPSRPVSTPTGPQLSSLSISTSGAWLQSGPPTCIQTVGKRLVGLSLKHWGNCAGLGRRIPVGSVFLKTTLCSYFRAQEKSKHGREKCQVCGTLFGRRDAAMKFTCTLTRGGGAQVTDGRVPWPIISRSTKIGSCTRPAGVDPGLFQRQKQQLTKHGQVSIRRAAEGSRICGQMRAAL